MSTKNNELPLCFHEVKFKTLSQVAKRVLQKHYPEQSISLDKASDAFKKELVKEYINTCTAENSNALVDYVIGSGNLQTSKFFGNEVFWDVAKVQVVKLLKDEITTAMNLAQ